MSSSDPPFWTAWLRRRAAIPFAVLALAPVWAIPAARAATVLVQVTGVAPARGRVYVSLCEDGFDPGRCGLAQVLDGVSPALTVTFSDVAPGSYAVAAFQDTNGNGTLDRSTHGLPLEPYGFSNGAGRTGPPRFERAAVAVVRDTAIAVRLLSRAGRE